MNIAFDATAILAPSSKNRGIGNYALSQFKKMIELDNRNMYFFLNFYEPFSIEELVTTDNVEECYYFTGKNHELVSDEEYVEIYGAIIKRFLYEKDIDVFYITSPFEYSIMNYRKEWFAGIKVVATVYDIIPFVMKKIYLRDKISYNNYMKKVELLRWVDEYFVISNSVKEDMVSCLKFPKEHIHVIYGAVDEKTYRKLEISEIEKASLYSKFGIHNKYIMCTGGDDARKNITGLIKAYAKVRKEVLDNYQLVIVCKLSIESEQRYLDLVMRLGLENKVILTNFVSTDELIKLYNLATLMVFPSLYEGFGLPILEAWKCGTPVITSNNSSLQEIAGDGAILVDADSIDSIAEGINKALLEIDLEELLVAGIKRSEFFSWESVAKATIDGINALKGNKMIGIGQKINRIAMFTPLPPIESGIADYSVDIANQLSKDYYIDIYIDKYAANFKENEKIHVYSYKEFEKNYNTYDKIIYQVGNSLYHKYMFAFIRKYPGIVVLHDYNLRNVLEAMYLYKSNKPKVFEEKLLEDYDASDVDRYMKNLNKDFVAQYEVNGFVTNYADKIIVHSNYAKKKLLERNIGRDVVVIPHYNKIENSCGRNEVRKRFGISDDELIFAAFGHIHETKRIIPILHAFAEIKKKESQAKLYLVGKIAVELQDVFEQTVKKLGIKESLFITGYTSLEDFEKYMDLSDICLNLRYPYNGESSGSFMRLLGKGKCTIVNRIGSFAEVPENACIMIDSVENMSFQEEVREIVKAMSLALNDSIREKIQKCALEFSKENTDINIIGKEYSKQISKSNKNFLTEKMIKDFADKYILGGQYSEQQLRDLAYTLSYAMGKG